jgi:rubrerythrin
MAIWKCEKCGHEKEGRCKPKKCPTCEKPGSFIKKD